MPRSTSTDALAAIKTPLKPATKDFVTTVEVGEKDGKASNIALPEAVAVDEAVLLRGAGLDPKAWEIEPGTRRHKRWQRYDGEWLNWWSFSFRERRADTPAERVKEIGDLRALFNKRPPSKAVINGDDAFVFWITDLQTGKNTEHTIKVFRTAVQTAKTQIKFLRKIGHPMPTLFIPATGDIVEGCDGFYSQQTYGVDLNRRDQVKVARRLVREAIEELAPLFTDVQIVVVGGNHGENRKDGKSYTTDGDNDDVAIFEMLQEVLEDRPGFEHVHFQIAEDQLSTCVEIAGVNVGLTHGHLLEGGGKLASNKAEKWWTGQIWGLQPVSKATILLSGHYHHVAIQTFGPRTWIQAPAVDGGSKYFTDKSGSVSPDGVMTFRLDSSHPLGWDNLRVL